MNKEPIFYPLSKNSSQTLSLTMGNPKVVQLTHIWNIDHFGSWFNAEGIISPWYLKSQPIMADPDHCFYLLLFPRGEKVERKDWVEIHIENRSEEQLYINGKISLLDEDEEEDHTIGDEREWNEKFY